MGLLCCWCCLAVVSCHWTGESPFVLLSNTFLLEHAFRSDATVLPVSVCICAYNVTPQ